MTAMLDEAAADPQQIIASLKRQLDGAAPNWPRAAANTANGSSSNPPRSTCSG